MIIPVGQHITKQFASSRKYVTSKIPQNSRLMVDEKRSLDVQHTRVQRTWRKMVHVRNLLVLQLFRMIRKRISGKFLLRASRLYSLSSKFVGYSSRFNASKRRHFSNPTKLEAKKIRFRRKLAYKTVFSRGQNISTAGKNG